MTQLNVQRAVTASGTQENVCVEFINGVITNISPAKHDCIPGTLIPGFIDLHCHGGGGFSFDIADEATSAAEFHAHHGTTTVIASLVSNPVDEQVERLRALAPLVADNILGGVHMEGPFLSHHRCGAQNPAVLTTPTDEEIAKLLPFSVTTLKLITIAPEIDCALDAIDTLTKAGVIVAIGHSDATPDDAAAATNRGATLVTHLFNAMPKLDQDQLGIGSFALAEPSLFTEVIADGHHLPVEVIKTIAAAKGDKMVAVTDAISATGMPDGDYVLGGLNVTSSQGAARLTGKTTLAGSTLTMDRAFDFLVNQVGITLEQAVVATSTAPAQVLLRKDLGTIEIGARADLVLWNDGVKQVWKNGTLI